jgi:hypothetical protein
MTRIGNPTPGLVATPLPQGAPAAALLAELPAGVGNMALGTFLTGTVLDRAANGLTVLQTANGILALKTTVPLPPGAAVTLQIQTAGAQIQAIVLSITPQAGKAQPAPTQAAPLPGGQPAPAATAQTLATPQPAAAQPDRPAASSTITATVIGPAGGPVPATAAPQAAAAPQMAATPATAAPTAAQGAPPAPAATPQATAGPVAAAAPSPATAAAPNQPQQAPASPAAAQAAYQRQLNAVPAASPHAAPLATPAAAQPVLLSADPAAMARAPAAEAAPAPLPTGTQVQLRLVPTQAGAAPAFQPQADVHAEAAAAALARQAAATPSHPATALMMATVVARTPAGQVILDSAVGRLLAALPRDGDATAPGARLLLELVTGERLAAAPRPTPAQSGIAALARNWAGLKEAMRQLQEAPGQQDAYAALERALPKAGPRLGQQMLAYLENAQQGVKTWLGETALRALTQAGRGPEQLERDLREMQLARQNAEGDWRMTLVPLLDGQQLRQIRFFERQRKQQEEKRKKEEPARFVVECETSEHGALQLDGLMHEQRLDLIVRSHAPLPSDMERDILVLFGETCTGLNLAGQLFFQAVPAFPINPLDDVAAEPVRVSV